MQVLNRAVWIAGLFAVACAAQGALREGTYKGKWEGASGASGDFEMTLTPDGDAFKPTVTFTLGSEEVKTKVNAWKIGDGKLSIRYSFELQGNAAESTVEGAVKSDGTVAGTYKTKLLPEGGDIDTGSWSVSAPPK
jgi:hypothetical protein